MSSTAPLPPTPPAAPKRRRFPWKGTAIGVGAFILGAAVGSAGGQDAEPVAAGAPAPVTVTATAPAPAPAPVTVTAPAPAPVTVTATVTAAAPAPAQPRAAATIPGDGVYVVGEDIEPGTYRTEGSEFCYWARLSGLGGSFEDIITNGTGAGPQVVQIAPGDAAFQTSGCGSWSR